MGFALVEHLGSKSRYLHCGVLRIADQLSLPQRLEKIFVCLSDLIDEYQPQEFAIESVFMAKSAASALKLGQARGAAIAAAVSRGLPVCEYEARKVKQAVVGTGAADKSQVQHMVKLLLNLNAAPQEDAADALAVALCHAHTQQNLERVAQSRQFRRGRLV